MCDVSCVYTAEELAKLSPKARAALQKELTRQIRASPEIRLIQDAHLQANKNSQGEAAWHHQQTKKAMTSFL